MRRKAAYFSFFIFHFSFALAADYPLLSADTPQGPVSVVFSTDAPALSLDRDLTATLTATAPAGVELTLPPVDTLRSRFQGFSLAEGFSASSEDGRTAFGQSIRWRLRADPAAPRYRLAPFAVGISSPSGRESRVAAPLLLPVASLPADARQDVDRRLSRPGERQVVFRLRHDRAHRGEDRRDAAHKLLGSGLVERGLFKDFYVELTHVVRRYIERAYGIHAPRQTTDEFLVSAKGDPRFGEESVSRLSGFLRSADMVKFAGVQATPDMASNAATSARDYIRSDAAASSSSPSSEEGRTMFGQS